MNREIKFRAWTGNRMIDFEEIRKDRVNTPWNSSSLEWLQYTGLKDKNGKEIYQGDILEYVGGDRGWATTLYKGKYEVRADLITGVSLVGFYEQSYLKNPEIYKDFEIIGNIYESPSLVESGEGDK